MMENNDVTVSGILYLTTECQLRCKYCYEAEVREKMKTEVVITKEEIREAIDFFIDHNSNNKNLCLFGGEPLLAWDEIKYAIDYSGTHPDLTHFNFNIITNGIRLGDDEFFEEFIKTLNKYQNIYIKLEISYDGSGQSERTFPDGSETSSILIKVLDKLNVVGQDFFIRYTLNRKTYDCIEKELIYLYERYSYLKGITINIACKDLDKINGNYKVEVDKKRPVFRAIYSLYNKPICGYVCDLCKICKPTDFDMHYIPTIGNKISDKNQSVFDRWNPLIGEKYVSPKYNLNGEIVE
jgi:sulfatase maturation enzyme AslB (radical SAM superfamily)